MIRIAGAFASFVLALAPASAQEAVTLKSADGLEVTADLYRASTAPDATWIVLAHQAQSSRGEYRTIAPRLNELGFNTIALDQRSGRAFAGVTNQTAKRARKARKKTTYLAALPDVKAGIAWARKQTSGKVILWGSSYSAAMTVYLAGSEPQLVEGALAMSPGEFLRGRSVRGAAAKIKVPVFITSAANEGRQWRRIFAAIPGAAKRSFLPKSGGRHGSSALIPARNKSHAAYWGAVEDFLQQFRPGT